jgi:hypothetical protein
MKAYWFEPADGALQYGDGRKPEAGVTHKVDGPLKLCERGLHASIRPLDALQYAQSNIVWVVELSGDVIDGADKCCATERTYIRRIDAEPILFECARRFALSVANLWGMPSVVREFLETGNKDLRDAARDAALATARDAALAAARAASWDPARAASWAAALAAARNVALATARDASWDPARAASWAPARDAAWDAAWAEMNTLLQARLEAV